MHDLVSQTLMRRVDEPDGLKRMLTVSLAVHVVCVAILLLFPEAWRLSPDPAPRTVMTISLGGTPGPRTGGMTPMGGRPVQQVVPETPRPQPVTPPAAKPPAMTVPTKEARPKAASPKPIAQAPDEARSRRPTTGPQVKEGSALAQTLGTGKSIGLSTGGGGAGGQINLGDFCCPEYIQTMLQIINRSWRQQQGVTAVTVMRFVIARDGTLSDIRVSQTSGYPNLDIGAQRALLATRLPQLPSAYPHSQLEVELGFHYIP